MRRRFSFITLRPSLGEKFRNHLLNNDVEEDVIGKIQHRIASLNEDISRDSNLGRGFEIGHSYFCNVTPDGGDNDWYCHIIQHEIGPLLEEYWFDNEDLARSKIQWLTS